MSDTDIQGGEILKPETAEILKELEAEGHSIEGKEPKIEEPTPEEPKVEEPKTDEPESEPEKVEDQPKVEKPKREVQAVPVNKYNEERHKRQEAERKLAELEAQRSTPTIEVSGDVKDVANQFAEKHGLDADLVTELFDTATKLTAKNTSGLSDEEIKELRALRETARQQAESLAFDNDFSGVAKTLEKEGLDITGHKDQIKQLAYTEGYTSTSLRAIALEYAHDNGLLTKGRKTLEPKQAGRVVESEAIDFDSLSEEQAKALPDDQWEKFVDHQIKKQHRAQGITA